MVCGWGFTSKSPPYCGFYSMPVMLFLTFAKKRIWGIATFNDWYSVVLTCTKNHVSRACVISFFNSIVESA